MRKKLVALSILLVSSRAWAGPSVNIWTSIESQVRGRQSGGRSVPLNAFSKIALTGLPKEGRADSYLQYSYEFGPRDKDFNLYNLSVELAKLGKWIALTGGRQTVVHANFEGLMDGLDARVTKGEKGFFFDIYGGLTRFVDRGDFKARPGMLTGAQAGWRPTDDTSVMLTTFYRRDDYRNARWDTSSTQTIGLAASQRFGATRTFQVYADGTYDAAGKTVPEATAGFMWQATPDLMINANGSRYDTSRVRAQTTILSLFADDDVWQARAGVRYRLGTYASLFANYDWQQLEAGGKSRTGHVAEGGVDFDVKKARVAGRVMYRYLKSYGGKASDFLATLTYQPWKFLGFDHFTNFTHYSKITSETDNAIATGVGAIYTPTDLLALRLGGEFLSNDHFSSDWRFTGSLAINWDSAK